MIMVITAIGHSYQWVLWTVPVYAVSVAQSGRRVVFTLQVPLGLEAESSDSTLAVALNPTTRFRSTTSPVNTPVIRQVPEHLVHGFASRPSPLRLASSPECRPLRAVIANRDSQRLSLPHKNQQHLSS